MDGLALLVGEERFALLAKAEIAILAPGGQILSRRRWFQGKEDLLAQGKNPASSREFELAEAGVGGGRGALRSEQTQGKTDQLAKLALDFLCFGFAVEIELPEFNPVLAGLGRQRGFVGERFATRGIEKLYPKTVGDGQMTA